MVQVTIAAIQNSLDPVSAQQATNTITLAPNVQPLLALCGSGQAHEVRKHKAATNTEIVWLHQFTRQTFSTSYTNFVSDALHNFRGSERAYQDLSNVAAIL